MKRFMLIGAALAGCSAARPETGQIAQETAEHRALVSAMATHPSLKKGGRAEQGKPLTFARTVPPRPEGVEPANHHALDTPDQN